MKNGIILFAGIFLTLAFSWALLILFNATHPLYGQLEPHQDEVTREVRPAATAGLAERGRAVYAEMGCVSCHTQVVRRPGFGSDTERGWGERQSVARDYVGQQHVHLGAIRVGPDLRNVGDREVPEKFAGLSWEDYHHLHLYDPRATAEGSVMPAFSFLYETRKIVGQPSSRGLPIRTEPGYEVVPTARAVALVHYLRSLRLDYDLPEAVPAAAAQEEHNEQE